MWKEMQAKMA
ncbi:hypothetical protein LINPERPRIM_LOCUS31536 [Linum perenne]